MKQQFTSVAQIAAALRDTDLVDDVVRDLAGNDKELRARLMDVVETHFVADARVWSQDRINAFAEELFSVANPELQPA